MDANTCKVALQIAAQFMKPAALAKYTTALRKEYLSSEIARVEQLMSRKVQPVEQYRILSAQLPVLQQQLAAL